MHELKARRTSYPWSRVRGPTRHNPGDAMLKCVLVEGLIRRVLDERLSHTASSARFEDCADETLKITVSWGHHAELFAYD